MREIRVFLCGDVMTGRGIDQILPHPCANHLYEGFVKSASVYIRLAEERNGRIPIPVSPAYIWGAALDEWEHMHPDARVINLETSITRSEDYVPKGINYRMSPENAVCLRAAAIDCCVLGNNHVLDWGSAGLVGTLSVLEGLTIKTAGAGRDFAEARAPAILEIDGKGRLIVFSLASPTSGVPPEWAATNERPGVNFLPDFTEAAIATIREQVAAVRKPDDVIIGSIHWGPNWGYAVPLYQRYFAHALIDRAAFSIVHGHSSHHPKAIEIYKNRLILYGCGDLLNDYEGIGGDQAFRSELVLMYFVDIDPATGDICNVELTPLRIFRFQLTATSNNDRGWIRQMLDHECGQFGVRIESKKEGRFLLSWQ